MHLIRSQAFANLWMKALTQLLRWHPGGDPPPQPVPGLRTPHRRTLEYRHINVRRWDCIVTAWTTGDSHALDDAWTTGVLPDLGSQWGQYEYVTNIGFAA